MNQTFHYQLLFIGNKFNEFSTISKLLKDKFEELSIPPESLLIELNDDSNIKGNQPVVVVVYNSSKTLSSELSGIIERQKTLANTILPLYSANFNAEISDLNLVKYNGLQYKSPDYVVSIILEGFNLLRKRRSLFLSYRQHESRNIALQLYDYFSGRNFDVFLDTHSIPKGVDFQNNLFHRMMDCDAVILLDTSDFLGSPFCKEEFERAITHRIGILRVKWPDSSSLPAAGLTETFSLSENDFDKGVLKKSIIEDIDIKLESLRVRSLASRQDALTTEFVETARRKNKDAIQIYPNVISVVNDTSSGLFIAAIGVPTSSTFQNIEELLKLYLEKDCNFTVLYDDLSILQSWINHIEWLCEHPKIQVLKKSDFEKEI